MKRLITICLAVGILLTASANVKGDLIADPCLWLHFDSVVDGNTTTFDSSPRNHTPITFVGNAQLDTGVIPAVGTASLLLDGTGDYLTVGGPEADFDICALDTDDWTVDFYVRHDDHAGTEYYVRHGAIGSLRWMIYHEDDGGTDGLAFTAGTIGSPQISLNAAGEIQDTDWHWIVLAKVGTEYALYKDGTQVSYTSDGDNPNASGVLYVGGSTAALTYLDGNMDELRIFHANVFDAAPNSGLSDIITNVPEPATIALLGFGALSLIRRKK